MSISFNRIPANWKLPLVWIEVDPSRAGTITLRQPALLFGQKFAAGAAAADAPIAVASIEQAQAAFGPGSMIERMFARFQAINAAAVLYCIPQAEPAGGVVAEGLISVTHGATAAGILAFYIGGQRVPVTVAATDTAAQIATKIAAAINADALLPVTAVATAGDVEITCRWKGETGNDIVLADSILGAIAGETRPAGVTLAYTAMSGGAGAPDLAASIAALGDEIYDYVAFPYTDAVSLAAIDAEYGFGDNGRWGWMRQTYGTVFSARRDDYAGQMTWGAAHNSAVISVLDVEKASPTPVWEWAAAYTARAARDLLNDPARPLQTEELTGCWPAPLGARRNKAARNALVSTGLAVQSVNANGWPMIEVEASLYQKNTLGQGDTAYFVITTLHTLAAIFRRLQSVMSNKYPRHKLANDGTRFAAGQAIVTPNIIRSEFVALYRAFEEEALVENANAFIDNLIVTRNATNPNRVDVLFPPDIVNQMRQLAILAQFRLQYPTSFAA